MICADQSTSQSPQGKTGRQDQTQDRWQKVRPEIRDLINGFLQGYIRLPTDVFS
jgi:hypothetical protein